MPVVNPGARAFVPSLEISTRLEREPSYRDPEPGIEATASSTVANIV